MQWLGARTAESFNRRYEAFSVACLPGRFGSRLVEDDGYVLELARYLPLNPVKAGLCEAPGDWGVVELLRLRPAWCQYPAFLEFRAFLWAPSVRQMRMSAGSPTASSAAPWTSTDLCDPRPRPSLASLLETDCDQAIAAAHFRHGSPRWPSPSSLGVSRAQIWRRLGLSDFERLTGRALSTRVQGRTRGQTRAAGQTPIVYGRAVWLHVAVA